MLFDVRSKGICGIKTFTTALSAPNSTDESSFDIYNSKIKVFSKFGSAIGIMANTAKIFLDKSKIKVQSLQSFAYGIESASTVEFIDYPSTLVISSPVHAESFYAMLPSFKLLNNSNPPSQCLINDGVMQDC